jgi:hypothetical protein
MPLANIKDWLMKAKRLFALFMLAAALAGCKGRADSDLSEPEETIREMVLAKDAAATWTRDFAPAAPQKLAAVALQPDNLAAASAAVLGNPVYPALPGFASLDRSNLSPEALAVINGFCYALSSGNKENARSRMRKETAFFVDIIFLDLGISGAARSPFDARHLVGKPEVIAETWQVPVRLFTRAAEHLDIQVFLMYDGGRWVVDQISYGELSRD